MVFSIIVLFHPNWVSLSQLIKNLDMQSTNIILVDNTPEMERQYNYLDFNLPKNLKYLDLKDNKGIAKAQNEGINEAIELGAEYFLIFDQDSSISENFVSPLLALHKKLVDDGNHVAAVGPVFWDIKSNIVSPVVRYDGIKIIKATPLESEEFTMADHIISSGSLISVDAIREIGLMDEKLFIDYVDLEWGMRAKKKGYSCYVANQVKMLHSIGDKSIKIPLLNKHVNVHSDFRKYFILRNAFYLAIYSDLDFYWRYHQILNKMQYLAFLIVYVPPRFNNLRIFFSAFYDAVTKNMNKGSR